MKDLYPEFRPSRNKLMFWLARIFGKKIVGCDFGDAEKSMLTIGYKFRGRLWITRTEEVKPVKITNEEFNEIVKRVDKLNIKRG